jgi:Rieske Fe-S protein
MASTRGEGEGGNRTGRRRILNYLLATSIGASLISILYPAIRFLIPPKTPQNQANEVVATQANKLPPNSGIVFKFGTEPAIVIRTPSGVLKAFTAICTHLQCTVHYRPAYHDIFCPCHGGRYNLNGVPVAGPPPRPLAEYTVHERGGNIIVSRG